MTVAGGKLPDNLKIEITTIKSIREGQRRSSKDHPHEKKKAAKVTTQRRQKKRRCIKYQNGRSYKDTKKKWEAPEEKLFSLKQKQKESKSLPLRAQSTGREPSGIKAINRKQKERPPILVLHKREEIGIRKRLGQRGKERTW